ncbi:MAG: isochorismatase family protein [Dysgonamonadaceae bacterium]|jgi:alpha-L-fucosidase|nr:isochorismatase family protein [Dysgonamonadaceae bacterium]
MEKLLKLMLFVAVAGVVSGSMVTAQEKTVPPMRISMQSRIPSESGESGFITGNRIENWNPHETAIIICDMWDRHWCDGATARVAEMAPAMNELLETARRQGITIIHAPSDCMDYYTDSPGRKEISKYNDKKIAKLANGDRLPSEENAVWPIDQSDEGCENAECQPRRVWSRQTDLLTITDGDLISDSGAEIGAYFKKKKIKNVILAGVHTNMCVIGRSFGLRAMKKMGMNVVLMRDMTDLMYNPQRYPYTTHLGGLALMVEYIEKYVCPTVTSSDVTGKAPFVFREAKKQTEAVVRDRNRNIYLPETDYHLKVVTPFVEREPDPDYLHASEAAHEAFRDTKFSVRIHWGIYSIRQMNGESWGFLNLPDEKKQEYNQLYKTFHPAAFDADEWMSFFKRSGLQAFAFTTKHHEGFSMFDTKTRVKRRANYLDRDNPIEDCDVAYSIMETPFKRDVVRELTDAAQKNGIKTDLYFSHPDWYDADFRPYNGHPLTTLSVRTNTIMYGNDIHFDSTKIMTPERTPEETNRLVARHREQLRELLTNYGKIDMLCLDQWLGADVWPETKATIKMIRQLQPDILIRCRGIGNYGDYYTPEGFVPGSKENTNMPWMVIYPLASSFSYDKDGSRYKGASWIIANLADAVAKGGSFMVGIGPDGDGQFHPKAIEQLEETGRWLAVNGEGIYHTRARAVWKEGNVRFTQSKDGRCIYAFIPDLSVGEISLESVRLRPGSDVRLLGYHQPLLWTASGKGVKITVPDDLQNGKNLPCEYLWTLKFEDIY